MPNPMNIETITPETLKDAISIFVDNKMLVEIGHGFCWTCSQEKSVYDISSEFFPSQEPKCGECIIETAMMALKLPGFVERVDKEYLQFVDSVDREYLQADDQQPGDA
jgi:hypothetical protein